MQYCLLAPVPVEHISSAKATFAKVGRVAFATGDPTSEFSGSSTWELFTGLMNEGEFGILPVYIHCSLSGQPPAHPDYNGLTASWRGVLAGYDVSKTGKHVRPEERPKSALLTDSGKSVGYWIIEKLVNLEKEYRIPLSKFRTFRSGKPGIPVGVPLHGPMRAFAPD